MSSRYIIEDVQTFTAWLYGFAAGMWSAAALVWLFS